MPFTLFILHTGGVFGVSSADVVDRVGMERVVEQFEAGPSLDQTIEIGMHRKTLITLRWCDVRDVWIEDD